MSEQTALVLGQVAGCLTVVATSVVLFALRKFWGGCRGRVGNGAIFGWLLFCIFASDLVGGLNYAILLHFIHDKNWCQVQGAVSSMHSILSAILNALLTFESYKIVSQELSALGNTKRITALSPRMRLQGYVAMAFLFTSCVVLGVELSSQGYTYEPSSFCSILEHGNSNVEVEIFGFYLWIWASLVVCGYYSFRLLFTMCRVWRDGTMTGTRIRSRILNLLIYPTIFIAGWVPSTIRRLVLLVSPSSPMPFEVGEFAVLLSATHGLFNALALSWSNPMVRYELFTCCRTRTMGGQMQNPVSSADSREFVFARSGLNAATDEQWPELEQSLLHSNDSRVGLLPSHSLASFRDTVLRDAPSLKDIPSFRDSSSLRDTPFTRDSPFAPSGPSFRE